MNIADVLLRNPATHPLINQGQARLTDHDEERGLEELRGELASFVCEGQYAEGIQKIVRSFIDQSALRLGKRLLRQRQVAPPQNAGTFVGQHPVSGWRHGSQLGARHAAGARGPVS